MRPVGGRLVFSSSEDLTRSTRAKVAGFENSFVSWINGAAESLFATLFPPDCRLCGSPLVTISRLPVCGECLSSIRPLEGAVCGLCGGKLSTAYRTIADGEPRCPLCRQTEPAFAKASAYGSYEGGLRDLIHLLKYGHVLTAANLLGRMLAEVVEGLGGSFGDVPVVVPVPLHSSKLRERGFNQSELIARAAVKLRPAGLDLAVHGDVLARRRPTASQTGLTHHQRQENMRGAFQVVRAQEISNREVLLIDDVLTTGTTASECARVLRRAGATRVWVATVARTLKAEQARMVAQTRSEDEEQQLSMAAHGRG